MSSKYAPATTPRKSPPWCKPGMFPAFTIVPGEQVPTAIVNAYWYDTTVSPVAQSAEFLRVFWNAALNGWRGASIGPGYELTVEIVKTPTPDLYDVTLFLTYDGAAVDDESWHAVPIAPFPNFDSGPLDHVYTWPHDANGVWIRA